MIEFLEEYKVSNWYSSLAKYTFPTYFVDLNADEIDAIANSNNNDEISKNVIKKLRPAMKKIRGNSFVFADSTAPKDTERFLLKRGAVYSPESAWKFLLESRNIQEAAKHNLFKKLCVRPFRRITKPREFRLFIYRGDLKAVSQYWLIRHYKRLAGLTDYYWELLRDFVEKISYLLPSQTVVMDVYVTSRKNILIIDFNNWKNDTDPLLLRTWNQNWTEEQGLKLIPPPTEISGDINVSF